MNKDFLISKLLWSLGGAGNTWEDQNRYSKFYEFVVMPQWFKSQGINYLPVLGPDNYLKHIDGKFWRPGSNVIHTCDVKAPRKGPKGMFVGFNDFTDDICLEHTSKVGGPGSLLGEQEWSFYFVYDDPDYKLVGIKQASLRAWVEGLIASGEVSSPECVENMSERARTHRDDMYYHWFQTEGRKDSFMFVPLQHLIGSGVKYFICDVTDCVRQAYDELMMNGGVPYLDTFKYED